jgi:hypothetical protein
MGIYINSNTELKATLKLYNQIETYLFEEECGEMLKMNKSQEQALIKAKDALHKFIFKKKK